MKKQSRVAAYFTRFEHLPHAGGGCRRFVQMFDDLSSRYEIAVKSTRDQVDFERATKSNAQGISSIAWSDSYHASQRYLLMGEYWAREADLTRYDVIFVDDPVYFPELVYRANSLDIPIVGICHNLETLAEGQVVSDRIAQSLKIELGILQNLDGVVTISQEENFVLRNLGINAYFHPYYPCEAVESRMHEIKRRRTDPNNQVNQQQVLFFGSLGNMPTRLGLELLLDNWAERQLLKNTGYELVVTGFGSEDFLEYAEPELGIRVLGPLSNEQLDNQLATAASIVIYQGKGSGALTRVNESLVAGVNVLANEHAARSYRNLSGVIEFADDFSNLECALKDLGRSAGQQPTPVSKPNVDQLIRMVESASNRAARLLPISEFARAKSSKAEAKLRNKAANEAA